MLADDAVAAVEAALFAPEHPAWRQRHTAALRGMDDDVRADWYIACRDWQRAHDGRPLDAQVRAQLRRGVERAAVRAEVFRGPALWPVDLPDLVDEADLAAACQTVLATLTAHERAIMTRRFGFGCAPATMAETGAAFGVTRERIRQIEARALRKLRHPSRARLLWPYLPAASWRPDGPSGSPAPRPELPPVALLRRASAGEPAHPAMAVPVVLAVIERLSYAAHTLDGQPITLRVFDDWLEVHYGGRCTWLRLVGSTFRHPATDRRVPVAALTPRPAPAPPGQVAALEAALGHRLVTYPPPQTPPASWVPLTLAEDAPRHPGMPAADVAAVIGWLRRGVRFCAGRRIWYRSVGDWLEVHWAGRCAYLAPDGDGYVHRVTGAWVTAATLAALARAPLAAEVGDGPEVG